MSESSLLWRTKRLVEHMNRAFFGTPVFRSLDGLSRQMLALRRLLAGNSLRVPIGGLSSASGQDEPASNYYLPYRAANPIGGNMSVLDRDRDEEWEQAPSRTDSPVELDAPVADLAYTQRPGVAHISPRQTASRPGAKLSSPAGERSKSGRNVPGQVRLLGYSSPQVDIPEVGQAEARKSDLPLAKDEATGQAQASDAAGKKTFARPQVTLQPKVKQIRKEGKPIVSLHNPAASVETTGSTKARRESEKQIGKTRATAPALQDERVPKTENGKEARYYPGPSATDLHIQSLRRPHGRSRVSPSLSVGSGAPVHDFPAQAQVPATAARNDSQPYHANRKQEAPAAADMDKLAGQLERLLREEARRHGIDV